LILNWRDVDLILNNIGEYRARAAHQSAISFLSGDVDTLNDKFRGGKHSVSLFYIFPEFKIEAKAYAIALCNRKSADFTVADVASFMDRKFYEITHTVQVSDHLIHSVESFKLDLRRWGVKFRPNSQRPYLEGHERSVVVSSRKDFVSYLMSRKDQYYTISEADPPRWRKPKKKPCVLICKFLSSTV
jgi:hypothetical protein